MVAAFFKSCLPPFIEPIRVNKIGQMMLMVSMTITAKPLAPKKAIKKGSSAKLGKLCDTSKKGSNTASKYLFLSVRKANTIAIIEAIT